MSDSPAEHMKCLEVCGGSQLTARGVVIGGLDAWVYSKPHGQARRGGDVYYASSLRGRPDHPLAAGRRLRARNAGCGHRRRSPHADAAIYQSLGSGGVRAFVKSAILRAIQEGDIRHGDRQHVFRSQPKTDPVQRGTSAPDSLPGLARKNGACWGKKVRLACPGRLNLPLGILSITEYEHFEVELEPGDCIVAYTDALIESSDADGEKLGEDGVLRLLKLLGDIKPEKLIDALLGEIAERYPENLSDDDVTVLIVRANGGAQTLTFGVKMRAMARMVSAALRSIYPGRT